MNFKSFFSFFFAFSLSLGGDALAQEQKTEYLLIYNGNSFQRVLTMPGEPGSFSEPCNLIEKRALSEECTYEGFVTQSAIQDFINGYQELTPDVLENSGVVLSQTFGFQVVSIPPDDFSQIYRLATEQVESSQNTPKEEQQASSVQPPVEEEAQPQSEQQEEPRDRPEMIEDKYLAQIPSPEKIRHLGGWGSEEKPLLLIFIDKDGEETYYQSLDRINPRLKVSKATGIPPSHVELIRMRKFQNQEFGSYAIIQER